jgi:hydrogenase maturation protein HypF
MVPYTPLHHVLLRDVGRPLVMTSGNVTEEPIVKDNDEALWRLAPLADAFLLHNRDIHARYDDSVVQVFRVESQKSKVKSQASRAANPTSNVASQTLPVTHHSLPHHVSRFTFHTQLVRRARGYAPFPIRLPFDAPQVYAAGPLLKNTFTLARDTYAFVSQHIGDLENLETLEHYEAALATYRHLFRLEPELVACDLHPDYMSTRLAGTYAHEHGLPAPYPVQHHKAHIASVLADHGWGPDDGPVIGVALDGTGYGEDRRIWGGEWFVGDYRGFERVAHLAYLPLPGGDAAIRHPWRTAVAYLHALDLDEDLTLGAFCPGDVMRVRTMVDRELNTPQTSSMGRLFDAVSALLDVCHEATYEAQAAIELEQVASTALSGGHVHADAYPVEITKSDAGDGAAPYQIEPAPLLDALLLDRARGVATAEIALRFHATVAAMVVRVADRLRAETGIETVAISGGVFQNRLLLSLALPLLARAGFEVLRHHQVPPNDGCVSLGQAAMAAVSVT